MGGITVRFAPEMRRCAAFLAGADALLMPPVPDAAYDALLAAAQSGQITEERLDASVRRILLAKARLGLNSNRLVDLDALMEVRQRRVSSGGAGNFGPGNHVAAGYAAPVAAERDEAATRVAGFALCGPGALSGGRPGAGSCACGSISLIALRADTKFVKADTLKLPSPDQYDVAILALFVRVSDRKGNVDVPADQLPVIEQILKAGKPVIMVGLGVRT